ncbi:Gluconate transport-inducing protein [Entomophthora muscae]|uniref:Gluconate transport-inducing protein n=1 Tax=Entomophthora muscae TaxID=34485 RepID=A0ACC2SM93_9FUNG|nr:Gluconate transport-inducing protein [Entomophthora muscae]
MSGDFHGYISNIPEALILLEAGRRGHVRIISHAGPTAIRSGTTFLLEDTAGLPRDPRIWLRPRLTDGFLVQIQSGPDPLIRKLGRVVAPGGRRFVLVNYYTHEDLAFRRLITPSQARFPNLESIRAYAMSLQYRWLIQDQPRPPCLPPISQLINSLPPTSSPTATSPSYDTDRKFLDAMKLHFRL